MGYYTFVDNAVPTSSQWNANFRDQVVTQCTAATRPGSPVEGQFIFETDTNRVYYYDGSGWVILSEPWQAWSPTIVQSASVAGTVNRGYYRRSVGGWEGWFEWTSSAAGTAANPVTFSTPVTLQNAADIRGSFVYNDAGTRRCGSLGRNTTTTSVLFVENNAGAFGAAPAVTIASGDILYVYAWGSY